MHHWPLRAVSVSDKSREHQAFGEMQPELWLSFFICGRRRLWVPAPSVGAVNRYRLPPLAAGCRLLSLQLRRA